MMSAPPPRAIVSVLLLAALLIGLAQAALLPPWEGFDEPPHYSYFQQIAETGRWHAFDTKMSREIDTYLAVAPTTKEMHGPWTYYDFFAAGPAAIEAGRHLIQDRPAEPRAWVPGQLGNWQLQHPPLYYVVMVPAYLASKTWSLAAQLFFLRSFSYLLGWAGLCIVAVWAFRTGPGRIATLLPLAVGLWPFLFPGWFPEMGRLGNDSLVAVLAACSLVLVNRLISTEAKIRDYALFGLTLGLGLLTKATFLPVTAAAFIFLGSLAAVAKGSERRSARTIGFVIAAVLAMAVGGWWLALKMIESGGVTGVSGVIDLHAPGGLIAGLLKNLNFWSIVQPWGVATSFLWSSTWSFIIPPRSAMLPLVVLAMAIAYGCYRYLRRHGVQPIGWFVLLVLGLLVCALTYYSIELLAVIANATPGWYVHALAPILALLLGYGIAGAFEAPWLRSAMPALLLYPLAFLPAATILNVLFFAGCAPTLPGRQYFAWSSAAECLADYPRMYGNLAVLAWPGVGITLFVAGWMLALIGVVMAARYLRASSVASDTAYTSIVSTR